MNRVYATRFRIIDGDLNAALSEYESWVRDYYKERHKIHDVAAFGVIPQLPAGHNLQVECHQRDEDVVYEIDWMFFDSENNAFWISEVRLSSIGDEVHVEHQVQLISASFTIEPLRVRVGSPRVIRSLCRKFKIRKGQMRLLSRPYSMNKSSVGEFVALLESKERTVPLVLVTPQADGSPSPFDVELLAGDLAGVGIVAHAANSETTWELSAELGSKFGCYNGACRIYWPSFQRADSKHLHPLFLANDENSARVTRAIERTVFAAASDRFLRYPQVSEVIEHARESARNAQIAAHADDAEWKELAESYSADLSISDKRVRELETELSNLKALQAFRFEPSEDPEAQENAAPDREPATVAEAVAFGAEDFPHLDMLDSASVAAANSPFRRPQEVYAALAKLDDVAALWSDRRKAGNAGGDIRQMLIDSGLGRRVSMHISSTTRGRYGTDYTFERRSGERQIFEPHVTLGSGDTNNCCSIHFMIDEERSLLEIGYVGRHLPNTKS